MPVSDSNDIYIIDDGPFWAAMDAIEEQSLINCYAKDPKKYQKQVDEWENERGRKIGEPTDEEIELRRQHAESVKERIWQE